MKTRKAGRRIQDESKVKCSKKCAMPSLGEIKMEKEKCVKAKAIKSSGTVKPRRSPTKIVRPKVTECVESSVKSVKMKEEKSPGKIGIQQKTLIAKDSVSLKPAIENHVKAKKESCLKLKRTKHDEIADGSPKRRKLSNSEKVKVDAKPKSVSKIFDSQVKDTSNVVRYKLNSLEVKDSTSSTSKTAKEKMKLGCNSVKAFVQASVTDAKNTAKLKKSTTTSFRRRNVAIKSTTKRSGHNRSINPDSLRKEGKISNVGDKKSYPIVNHKRDNLIALKSCSIVIERLHIKGDYKDTRFIPVVAICDFEATDELFHTNQDVLSGDHYFADTTVKLEIANEPEPSLETNSKCKPADNRIVVNKQYNGEMKGVHTKDLEHCNDISANLENKIRNTAITNAEKLTPAMKGTSSSNARKLSNSVKKVSEQRKKHVDDNADSTKKAPSSLKSPSKRLKKCQLRRNDNSVSTSSKVRSGSTVSTGKRKSRDDEVKTVTTNESFNTNQNILNGDHCSANANTESNHVVSSNERESSSETNGRISMNEGYNAGKNYVRKKELDTSGNLKNEIRDTTIPDAEKSAPVLKPSSSTNALQLGKSVKKPSERKKKLNTDTTNSSKPSKLLKKCSLRQNQCPISNKQKLSSKTSSGKHKNLNDQVKTVIGASSLLANKVDKTELEENVVKTDDVQSSIEASSVLSGKHKNRNDEVKTVIGATSLLANKVDKTELEETVVKTDDVQSSIEASSVLQCVNVKCPEKRHDEIDESVKQSVLLKLNRIGVTLAQLQNLDVAHFQEVQESHDGRCVLGLLVESEGCENESVCATILCT